MAPRSLRPRAPNLWVEDTSVQRESEPGRRAPFPGRQEMKVSAGGFSPAQVPHESARRLWRRLPGRPVHHHAGGEHAIPRGLGEPAAQDTVFTRLLSPHQDEGSQGTDAPTPGNAENEPPEKEGLSPPRRTPAPPEPSSPAPGEGPSGRKRRRAPREGRRAGVPLTPELAQVQVGGLEPTGQARRDQDCRLHSRGAAGRAGERT